MRILLIEDERELRELLEYGLSRLNYKVTAAANANDALIMVEETVPDLILLDLMLPGLQGLQFLDIIRRKNQAVPVIIISARTGEDDIIKGLEHGADDYLPKPFSMRLLEAKINASFRRAGRGQQADSEKISSGGVTVDPESRRATSGDEVLQLTQKEFDLLSLFLRRPQKVFTRNQLLNIIWGYEVELVSRTVDAHVAMLRKKLGPRGSNIKTLPKIGYLWADDG
ncbi:MAG: response regulator transcription factor [Deltaproteobacteria bacterium]|jgi:two-component system phosphate regulon response regulator PhoB|nr:response regulator transcription factor [Deltaproteobacteria bacterium]